MKKKKLFAVVLAVAMVCGVFAPCQGVLAAEGLIDQLPFTYDLYDYLKDVDESYQNDGTLTSDSPWSAQIKVDGAWVKPDTLNVSAPGKATGYSSTRNWESTPGFGYDVNDGKYQAFLYPCNKDGETSSTWKIDAAYAFTAPVSGTYTFGRSDSAQKLSNEICDYFKQEKHAERNLSYGVRIVKYGTNNAEETIWPKGSEDYAFDGYVRFGQGTFNDPEYRDPGDPSYRDPDIKIPVITGIHLNKGEVLRVEAKIWDGPDYNKATSGSQQAITCCVNMKLTEIDGDYTPPRFETGNLILTEKTGSSLTFSWPIAHDSIFHDKSLVYKLYVDTKPITEDRLAELKDTAISVSGNGHCVTGLSPACEYYVTVTVSDLSNNTSWLSAGPFQTLPLGITGDCTWTVDGTVLTISGNGAIGDYTSSDLLPWGTSITEVVIEEGVTGVGNRAFDNCSSLTSVTIPDSVTSIGNDAFYNCSSLTSITIPDGVTSIGGSAFFWCSSLTSVTIPDSVTSIGEAAFYYCSSLTSVTIPDSVTSIGVYAFRGCSSLTSIAIPDSVTSIDVYAFDGCNKLTNVYYGGLAEEWAAITIGSWNSALTSANRYYHSTGLPGKISSIVVSKLPDKHKHIKNEKLDLSGMVVTVCCENGTTYKVGPEDLNVSGFDSTAVGVQTLTVCFEGHTAQFTVEVVLKHGTTGECTWKWDGTVLTISGNGAMGNYTGTYSGSSPWGTSITNVVIESGVTRIGNFAFDDCDSLTSVAIPNSVTSIGDSAFYNCSSLTSVTIPDGVNKISRSAFYNCSSLTSIIIPDQVVSVGTATFYGCSSLGSVTIGDSVTDIGSSAFYGCSSLTSVTIGDSVINICNWAFEGCSMLTSIAIPDSVVYIGVSAFERCNKLTNVYYGGSAEKWAAITIDSWNSALTSANRYYHSTGLPGEISAIEISKLPDKLEYDNREALDLSGMVVTVYCENGTTYRVEPENLKVSGFDNTVFGIQTLTVDFEGHTAQFTIEVMTSGVTGDCTWTLDGTVLTISGNGAMGDYSYGSAPWGTDITRVEITNGVTSVGNYAFYYCSSLTSITIPDGVTSVGNYAFYYCSSLTSVTIGDSVINIGYCAFYKCTSLTSITIPNSVNSIGNEAFFECLSLKRVDVANFDSWLQIFSGKIPSGAGAWAARGMDVYINGQRFTDLSVPNDTNYIKQACYYNLKSVENVFLPKNLTVVQYCAFYGCSGIQNVFFEGTAEEWAQVVIAAGNEYLEKANVYFNCTELPGKVVSIAVSKLPDKVQYLENQEELDLTGGVLTATYENGFEQEIDLSTLSVSGFNNAVSGKQNLSVHYKDLTAAFEVGVIKKYASVLAVATLPAKVIYRLGENLELNGATVLLGYSDGTYETLDVTADMVEGFDPNKTGGQILTVRHEGVSSQFVVEVFRNGDLDGDDSVSANDLVAIRKGLISLNEYDTHYDVNQDDAVNIKDLIRLKKMMFEPQA